ncbi:MAG: hypothetical protein HWN79_04205 [Candidatus Lokiarchaeota archaeon]|nr:hypothetical protein [Candidatus Lokiarchaeota archaeon]
MPNYCRNCGVQLKKKKGNCSHCGTPFVQDRKLQIPKRYQLSEYFYKKRFGELPAREKVSIRALSKNEDPCFHLFEAMDLMDEASDFLMDARDLLEKKVVYLWRKEIDLKYGLNSDKLPNYCSNCGYKITNDLISCPKCEEVLVYEKLEYEKAIGYIQKAIDIDPTNGDIKLILECAQRVLEEQNDPKNARDHLNMTYKPYRSLLNRYISRYEEIRAYLGI